MGRLLRLIQLQQQRKACEGCGSSGPASHFLEQPPRVFTLQLGWASQREEGGAICATLKGLGTEVRAGWASNS